MTRYRVAQVGLGHRGRIHAAGFARNPDRFELVALCDLDAQRLERGLADFGVAAGYQDAEAMLAATRPDVFCFVTQPHLRLPMVELGARYGVRAIALEKPMATSLREARAMLDSCRAHGIRAIVSHQQKYLTSMQKLQEIVDGGEIGQTTLIRATTQGWLSQLGTHFVDYVLWINGGHPARWVVGHAHGVEMLADSHPSCDYILGEALLANGVRATIECGYLAPAHMDHAQDGVRHGYHFWVDNRLTVYGTHGYAWADTDGRWGAFTRSSSGEVLGGEGQPWGVQEQERLQPLYLAGLADWLDDERRVHPCNLEVSTHGYELLEGLCLSAMDHTRVDLPLDTRERDDMNERMRRELPDVPPLP
jgi:predicted dehydrogenase